MKTFAERLAFARDQKGLNQSELAHRIHARIGRCTPQAVQKWESVTPKETIPRRDAMQAIVDELGYSVGWFMTGEGWQLHPLTTWDAGEDDDQTIDLPYFREVQFAAGNGRSTAIEQGAGSLRFSRQILREAGVEPEHAACATNCGDSMADKILDGAGIGIDRSKTQIKDGKIYAIDHDGLLRVKYLHRLPGGGVKLRSHNKNGYPDEDYPAEYASLHIHILGWVFWWSSVDRW